MILGILSYYEECVIIPENERQTCGSVALNDETECLKNEFCCYDPFVMPHCYIRVCKFGIKHISFLFNS